MYVRNDILAKAVEIAEAEDRSRSSVLQRWLLLGFQAEHWGHENPELQAATASRFSEATGAHDDQVTAMATGLTRKMARARPGLAAPPVPPPDEEHAPGPKMCGREKWDDVGGRMMRCTRALPHSPRFCGDWEATGE